MAVDPDGSTIFPVTNGCPSTLGTSDSCDPAPIHGTPTALSKITTVGMFSELSTFATSYPAHSGLPSVT